MPKNKQLIIICLLTLIVASVSIRDGGAIAPSTRMRLDPADLVVDLNETFVVQVVIEEAANLGAFQFDLTYDPSILQVQGAAVGDFLESTGQTVVPAGPEVNNAEGRAAFGAASFGGRPGPSGAGVLATITCIARGEGSTVLELQEIQVLDTTMNIQPIAAEDGRVVVTGAEGRAFVATPVPEPTSALEAVDIPTGSPSWAMPGLLLAALFMAILAVILLIRRAKG